MRALIMALLLSLAAPVSAETAFCAGFKKGFKEGACHNEYNCIPPIPPICPIPKVSEDRDSFEDGYQRGFVVGRQSR